MEIVRRLRIDVRERECVFNNCMDNAETEGTFFYRDQSAKVGAEREDYGVLFIKNIRKYDGTC